MCVPLLMSAYVNVHMCMTGIKGMHKLVCKCINKCEDEKLNNCVCSFMTCCVAEHMYDPLFCGSV